MAFFLVFLTCGLVELWALLVMWGFSAGPVNSAPYVALIGCLLLLLAAAPLALFLTRVSAAVALVGAAMALAWPVAIAFEESVIRTLPFAALPTLAAAAASWRLWRTRRKPWLTKVVRPRLWVRIVLCTLPVVLFISVFNARLVLAILWPGSH